MNIIAFGAHPDDCDHLAGGAGAKWAALGHRVRFVSTTNGDAGHHVQRGPELAARRRAEAEEAGRRIGVDYVVLDNHDGQLLATIEVREQIIRQIRQWQADLVIAHRPNDYHPDHRYTGMAVQDAAYMVLVPNLVPDAPALRKNPIFMYSEDPFETPVPFRSDVAVDIDDAIDRKVDMMDAHVSQYYEWLPWLDGALDRVPQEPAARKAWLKETRTSGPSAAVRAALARRYGPARAAAIRYAEAFQVCEYGARPDEALIQKLFPF